MNEVQLKTVQYLGSGEGSVGARAEALADLTADGFFCEATEEESTSRLLEFLSDLEEEGRFCPEGRQRFADAVLPGVQQRERCCTITLTLDVDYTGTALPSEVATAIARGVNLLSGQNWKVDNAAYCDLEGQ